MLRLREEKFDAATGQCFGTYDYETRWPSEADARAYWKHEKRWLPAADGGLIDMSYLHIGVILTTTFLS